MLISKETFFQIIQIILALAGLVLGILHFATDVTVNDTILFGYLAIMTSMTGFRKIKLKQYTGYFYIIYPVLWVLMVIKDVLE